MTRVTRRIAFSSLILLLIIGGSLAGLVLVAHQAALDRANQEFPTSTPVTAKFSRFHLDRQHQFSIVWKVHFAKEEGSLPVVAAWHLRPFGEVDFAGGHR